MLGNPNAEKRPFFVMFHGYTDYFFQNGVFWLSKLYFSRLGYRSYAVGLQGYWAPSISPFQHPTQIKV